MPVVLEATPFIYMEKTVNTVEITIRAMREDEAYVRTQSLYFEFAHIQSVIDGLVAIRDGDE